MLLQRHACQQNIKTLQNHAPYIIGNFTRVCMNQPLFAVEECRVLLHIPDITRSTSSPHSDMIWWCTYDNNIVPLVLHEVDQSASISLDIPVIK